MDKYNYEKIDWSKCPPVEKCVDIENINGHVMDIELPEDECNKNAQEQETVPQNSVEN